MFLFSNSYSQPLSKVEATGILKFCKLSRLFFPFVSLTSNLLDFHFHSYLPEKENENKNEVSLIACYQVLSHMFWEGSFKQKSTVESLIHCVDVSSD